MKRALLLGLVVAFVALLAACKSECERTAERLCQSFDISAHAGPDTRIRFLDEPILGWVEEHGGVVDSITLDQVIDVLHADLGTRILTAWDFPEEICVVPSEYANYYRLGSVYAWSIFNPPLGRSARSPSSTAGMVNSSSG